LLGDVSQAIPDTLTLSPDGKRFAVVTFDPRTKGRRVIVDGKPMGKTYDSIAEGTPIFSANGRGVAFAARLGTRCYIIHDGVESEGYPLVRDGWPLAELVFSPHGKYLAYKARVEGQCMQIVQGEKFGPYEVIVDEEGNRLWGVWDFCFSPDGESFAYRARVKGRMVLVSGTVLPGKGKDRLSSSPPCDSIGRGTPLPVPGHGPGAFAYIVRVGTKEYLAVWNGREMPVSATFDAIARGSITISPNSPLGLDYVARKGDQWFAVVTDKILGDKEGPSFDEISPLMHSVQGKVAYAARKGKLVHMVVDGVTGPGFAGIRYPRTVFSPDGQRIAYAARSDNASFVMAGAEEGPRFGVVDADSLTFSPDSKRLAYVAGKAGKRWLVLDGKVGPEFDEVHSPRFSANSVRLGYRARKNLEHHVVIDGDVLGPFADVSPDAPVFSKDGKRVAIAVLEKGRWQVLLDGKESGPACDGVLSQLTFSADGAHLAYVAKLTDRGRDECALVIDGKPGRRYDAIWMGEHGKLFVEPAGVEYFAKKGLLVYRVVENWAGAR